MFATLLLSIASYSFQKLDFIPLDLNDKGWIVGESRELVEDKWKTAAVLFAGGKLRSLGSYAGTGSAFAINNKGNILIKCEMSGLPKNLADRKPKWNLGEPFYYWSKEKASFLGFYTHTPRLMDSDRFIQSHSLVTIKNGKAKVKQLQPLPSRNTDNARSDTSYFDMNESGLIVGCCDFGYSASHAVAVNKKGKITDIYPNVDIHTGWMAYLVNAKGTVLGYHSYDTSIGGGAYFLWRNGKIGDLTGFEVNRPSASAAALNDLEEVVGVQFISESGSYLHVMANQEFYKPHIATVVSHAILWKDDKMLDLNDLVALPKGTVLTTAVKINNKGWIIGAAIADGKRFGYLLKPIGTDKDQPSTRPK